MSISSNGFLRDVVVTAVGAFIAVGLTFLVKGQLDSRKEKDVVCRLVANAYNENYHNINIITQPEKEPLLATKLAHQQISMDFIEELYRNVIVYKYLDLKYTTQYIPSMYKEYRRILTTLNAPPFSEKENRDNIELLYSFEELLREIGQSIMSDKKWEEYSIPWIEVMQRFWKGYKR